MALNHRAIGLANELGELSEIIVKIKKLPINNSKRINIIEELGDMCWYLAGVARFLGQDIKPKKVLQYQIHNASDLHQLITKMAIQIGKITEIIKAATYLGKPINCKELSTAFDKLVFAISYLCKTINVSLEAVLKKNIDKLRIRYPEKFTEEKALNRDRSQERKALSK